VQSVLPGLTPEKGLTDETMIVNGVTAWQMLHCTARRPTSGGAGQTDVVHGANGGVGGVLVQLAYHAGLQAIGTAAPRGAGTLRSATTSP